MSGPDPEQARATIEKWLERQGYPLEYETARQFGAAGFRVQQGIYYDPATAPSDRPTAESSGKPREIDVLAGLRNEPEGVTLSLIAECKHVQAGWVVLTTTAGDSTSEQDQSVHAALSCGSHAQLDGDAAAVTVSMAMWPSSSRASLEERLGYWGIELEFPGSHHVHHPRHWNQGRHRVSHPIPVSRRAEHPSGQVSR